MNTITADDRNANTTRSSIPSVVFIFTPNVVFVRAAATTVPRRHRGSIKDDSETVLLLLLLRYYMYTSAVVFTIGGNGGVQLTDQSRGVIYRLIRFHCRRREKKTRRDDFILYIYIYMYDAPVPL